MLIYALLIALSGYFLTETTGFSIEIRSPFDSAAVGNKVLENGLSLDEISLVISAYTGSSLPSSSYLNSAIITSKLSRLPALAVGSRMLFITDSTKVSNLLTGWCANDLDGVESCSYYYYYSQDNSSFEQSISSLISDWISKQSANLPVYIVIFKQEQLPLVKRSEIPSSLQTLQTNLTRKCFSSELDCQTTSGNCSNRGQCIARGGTCFKCQCSSQLYTGNYCELNNYIIPIHTVFWTSLILLLALVASVFMLLSSASPNGSGSVSGY